MDTNANGNGIEKFDESLPTGCRRNQHFFAVGLDLEREAEWIKRFAQRHLDLREVRIGKLNGIRFGTRGSYFFDADHVYNFSRPDLVSELELQSKLNNARIGRC